MPSRSPPRPQHRPQARLPGLATSAELCHALRRRGVRLGAASSRIMHNEQLLWHVANMLSEAPLRWAGGLP